MSSIILAIWNLSSVRFADYRCRHSAFDLFGICVAGNHCGIVEAIPQIEGIITAVLGSILQIIQAGIDLLVALIQALPEIITTIVAAIPEIIGSVVNALINSIPQIVQAGVTLFVSLIKNLPTIIVEIVKPCRRFCPVWYRRSGKVYLSLPVSVQTL